MFDIPLWENQQPEKRTIISVITSGILVGMISCGLSWQFAYSDSPMLSVINIKATRCFAMAS